MIEVYPTTRIYIVCPPDHATGGTELLHQLAAKLDRFGYDALMYYLPSSFENPTHPNFNAYNVKYVREIDDDEKNIIIMPEIYIDLFRSRKLKKIRKVIWWLSVDDYLIRLNDLISRKKKKPFFFFKKAFGRYKFPDLAFFSRSQIVHLVQSHYAFEFLQSNNIRVGGYLSDFLNAEFLSRASNKTRKNYILYNPLKGFEYTKKLIDLSPNLSWIPLKNLSPAGVAELLSESKVYVDFGHHPGKDRFPREAAIMGCCVITGKRGSAKYFEDVPIPDEFKFDELHVEPREIIKKIEDCLNNYSIESKKFDSYVQAIKIEENQFECEVSNVFIKQL